MPEPTVSVTLPGRKWREGYELPPGLSFDEFVPIRDYCELLVVASPWWLADACLYGRQHFPKQYPRPLPLQQDDPSGTRYERLKQALWMATKFPPATRVAGLSYTHHRAVARLEPEQRSTLLQQALSEHLSTRTLMDRVRARYEPESSQAEATPAAPPSSLPLVPLRRPTRRHDSGPLVEAQPWSNPQQQQPHRVMPSSTEMVTSVSEDASVGQLINAALGSLEAWERVFGRHRDLPDFASTFTPVFQAIAEVRTHLHQEVA